MTDNTQPINPQKIDSKAHELSAITLKKYVVALLKASKEVLPLFHEIPENERRLIKELLNAGLLSESRSESHIGNSLFIHSDVIILTPAGASALAEWSEFLKKESWWYKAGDSMLRALWVLLGAICALLPDIIRSFL